MFNGDGKVSEWQLLVFYVACDCNGNERANIARPDRRIAGINKHFQV